MCKHLTKSEKKKKLKQARKRAIVWSAQEQLRKALKQQVISKNHEESEPEDRKPKAVSPKGSQPDQRHPNQYTTVPTISDIEITLNTLQNQRDQLNITISVLQQQLQFLKSQINIDEDYEFE